MPCARGWTAVKPMCDGWAQLRAPPTPEQLDEAARLGIPAIEIDGRLNPKQQDFVNLSSEVQVFLGGFSAGKSFIGAWKCLLCMLNSPGCSGLALAPTAEMNKIQYDAVMKLLERLKFKYGIDIVESSKISAGQTEIRLTNGSVLKFRSAGTRSSLYGVNATFLWIDELELCMALGPDAVYEAAYSRVRQQSDGTAVDVKRHDVFITSTAHAFTGILADLVEQAKREKGEYLAALAAGDPHPKVPDVGYVRAPSTCAVGYGITQKRIDRWLKVFPTDKFLRGCMCELLPPEEVVFSDVVSSKDYPHGNVTDYSWSPENKTYLFVDWGLASPHVLLAQHVVAWDALVILDEWGPSGSSVPDTVLAMRQMLDRYGLVDQHGHPKAARRFAIVGDPTDNPGEKYRGSTVNTLSMQGGATCYALGWPYTFPAGDMRFKRQQIQFGRAMLKPRMTKPRILFSRYLTVDKDRMNAHKQTRRGIWYALTQGYKYKKNALGVVTDEPIKDKVWDHAVDALLYGGVIVFEDDFWDLFKVESGLYTGGAHW